MEAKLREKDAAGYPDWRVEDHYQQFGKIEEEWCEMRYAFYLHDTQQGPLDAVLSEAADVANETMILVDTLQPLCAHDGRGRAVEGE